MPCPQSIVCILRDSNPEHQILKICALPNELSIYPAITFTSHAYCAQPNLSVLPLDDQRISVGAPGWIRTSVPDLVHSTMLRHLNRK